MARPRGMVWGGRREEGSGWGTHAYLWRIHVDIWQNQYNIVKFKNKIKLKKKEYHTIAEQRKSELNPALFYAKSHSISIASGKHTHTHTHTEKENNRLFLSLSGISLGKIL